MLKADGAGRRAYLSLLLNAASTATSFFQR
jgi:hypothetical protein